MNPGRLEIIKLESGNSTYFQSKMYWKFDLARGVKTAEMALAESAIYLLIYC